MRIILVSLLAALALPAAAAAGGWATAGLAPPPDGIQPGDTWHASITLLQHGVTPLNDVRPSITLHGPDGPAGTFPARPTGAPGVYVAEVVFPSAGAYRYEVDDGFSQVHTFAPVEVGAVRAGSGLPAWTAVPIAAAATALAGAVLLLLFRRRRSRAPAPAAALD